MGRFLPFGRLIGLLLLVGAGSSPFARPLHADPDPVRGLASYYGRFHDGQRTASGEPFDMQAMTAAHRTLPFGTQVRVTNLKSGRAVVVRINDRGPFVKGRLLDLSYAAAKQLGVLRTGLARVRMEVI